VGLRLRSGARDFVLRPVTHVNPNGHKRRAERRGPDCSHAFDKTQLKSGSCLPVPAYCIAGSSKRLRDIARAGMPHSTPCTRSAGLACPLSQQKFRVLFGCKISLVDHGKIYLGKKFVISRSASRPFFQNQPDPQSPTEMLLHCVFISHDGLNLDSVSIDWSNHNRYQSVSKRAHKSTARTAPSRLSY